MSDEHFFEQQSPVIRLRVWALGQMVWGAFLAGAGLLAIAAVLLVIWGVSLLLDSRSKTMPSPYGALQIVQTQATV